MVKVYALVLDTHLADVTRALGRSGGLHLVNAPAQSRHRLLHGVDRGETLRCLEADLQKCRDLLEQLALQPGGGAPADADETLTLEGAEALLQAAWKEWQAEDAALGQLIEQSGLLAQRQQLLAGYPMLDAVRLRELRNLHHLHLITGRLSPAALPGLAAAVGDRLLLLEEPPEGRRSAGETRVLLLTSRKSRFAVEGELAKAGFHEEPLPADAEATGGEERRRVDDRLSQVRDGIEACRRRLRLLGERWRADLARVYHFLGRQLAIGRAEQQFGHSARLFGITGWVPRARAEEVRAVLAAATGGSAVVEFHTPADDEAVQAGTDQVPVEFPAHRLLRPFQMLVRVYGVPRYEEVEPSLFVALSFVVMFGLMFGDVGQGAVLALVGAGLQSRRGPRAAQLRDIGLLLILCGGSATVFGVLYGSVFGSEEIIPHYWVQPLQDVMTLFKAAIVLGILFISGGIVLNICNKIRKRAWFDGVFDRFGLIGILFYWGAIGLGLKAAQARVIHGWEIALVIGLPLLVLFVREPLHNLLRREKHLLHEDVFTFAMTAGMEVLETVTTFLGNTVSFVRIGAFALSHAALCMTIYILADMLKELPGGGFWNVLVIVLGNAFVIVLEGMVATIQGLRLQYYELFSKFFSGDGVLYQPFRLDSAGQHEDKGERGT